MNEEQSQEGMYPMMNQDSYNSKESIMYQLENGGILEDLYHSIRCEIPVETPHGDIVWKTPNGVKPLINEHGARSIIIDLKARINKIYILSDLDDETIYEMTKTIADNTVQDIALNWKVYQIKDISAASKIVHIVGDAVLTTLKKAKNRNYLRYLSQISQVTEFKSSSQNTRHENGKQGMWGSIKEMMPQNKYG
jgi:hypothetical protein